MVTITRKLEFDAGHRLVGHESKCRHLHGHRYVAEITCTCDELDSCGRVIDFSLIKSVVGGWIDANWDHNFIMNPEDLLASHLDIFGDKSPYLMPDGLNPTAENMVQVLAEVASELLILRGISVTRVRLYETPNCWAEAKIIHASE